MSTSVNNMPMDPPPYPQLTTSIEHQDQIAQLSAALYQERRYREELETRMLTKEAALVQDSEVGWFRTPRWIWLDDHTKTPSHSHSHFQARPVRRPPPDGILLVGDCRDFDSSPALFHLSGSRTGGEIR